MAPDIMAVARPHAGIWRGSYVHLDAQGSEVDRHDTEIVNAFPAGGAHAYVQTSRFSWADGRREEHVFPGVLRDNRLWWETARLRGVSWVSADAPGTMFLRFARVDLPGIEIFEMISMAAVPGLRMRTWHWLENGVPVRRTLVSERRVSTEV